MPVTSRVRYSSTCARVTGVPVAGMPEHQGFSSLLGSMGKVAWGPPQLSGAGGHQK